MPRLSLILMLSLLLLTCGLSMHLARAQQSQTRPVVYVVPIEGVIDLGLAPFVSRVLDEAAHAGAAAVVLDINTFGGRVDAAVQIRDSLLESKLRTVAFVDKRTISVGALIALSAQTVAMAPGGTIGAAAPVQAGAPGAASVPVRERPCSTSARNSVPPPRCVGARSCWPTPWWMPTSRCRASSTKASC